MHSRRLMLGLIISAAVGALLLWAGVNAIRGGTLEIGASDKEGAGWSLRRNQPLFWVVAVGILGSGAALIGSSLYFALFDMLADPAPPHTLRGRGFDVTVPGDWQPLDELVASLSRPARSGREAVEVVAYGKGDSELLVISPPPRRVTGGGTVGEQLSALASTLKDPALAYVRWGAERQRDRLSIDVAYRSPRGVVVGRIVAVIDAERRLRSYSATCSYEDDGVACRAAVASLTLSVTGLLPLDTELGTPPSTESADAGAGSMTP